MLAQLRLKRELRPDKVTLLVSILELRNTILRILYRQLSLRLTSKPSFRKSSLLVGIALETYLVILARQSRSRLSVKVTSRLLMHVLHLLLAIARTRLSHSSLKVLLRTLKVRSRHPSRYDCTRGSKARVSGIVFLRG